MNSSIIIMKSITEATKAKRQLSSYRIKCEIEKIHARRSGCCYGIRVHGNTDKICRLLSIVNIFCEEIIPA